MILPFIALALVGSPVAADGLVLLKGRETVLSVKGHLSPISLPSGISQIYQSPEGEVMAIVGTKCVVVNKDGGIRRVVFQRAGLEALCGVYKQLFVFSCSEGYVIWDSFLEEATALGEFHFPNDVYGPLPIGAMALSPKGQLFVGLGPDVYASGKTTVSQEMKPSVFRFTDYLERISSPAPIGMGSGASQSIGIIDGLWSGPSATKVIGSYARLHGSGMTAAFLLQKRDSGDENGFSVWTRARAIEGKEFAWSPDGKFYAADSRHIWEDASHVTASKAADGARQVQFRGCHLLGWLSSSKWR